MGLCAPVGASLSAWVGTRRAMTIGLVLIGVFGILRGLGPTTWVVVLLTLPVGIGMGIGNATAPLAVRETVPERPATGTGVYATGIQLGATISAAIDSLAKRPPRGEYVLVVEGAPRVKRSRRRDGEEE